MKAAIIGAGSEAIHTIEKAKQYELTVTALDGNPNAAGLKKADMPIVVDISDEKATIETLAKEKPDFVLTAPIGRYLTTIGAVNDALRLPGISREMAVLCTDKYRFHETLSSKGLRKCHCYTADDSKMTEILSSFKSTAILKPRYGSGSRGIHIFSDTATERLQLEEILSAAEGEEYLLEECIAGEEYGVDGAVTQDGFHMILLRRKENTPLPARQAVAYFSVLPSDKFWQQIHNYMVKVVDALGLKDCLFHADIIRTEEEPFIVELSARPSGHNLHNLFTPLCTGVDMAEEYIKYRMGLPYSFEPYHTKSMMIHYFDMQGRVNHVPDIKQAEHAIGAQLAVWECNLKVGEELKPVSDGHSVMGRGFFVIEGSNQPWLNSRVQIIKELFIE